EVVVGEGAALGVVEDVENANDLPALDERDGDHCTEVFVLVDGGARRVQVIVVHVEALASLRYLSGESFACVNTVASIVAAQALPNDHLQFAAPWIVDKDRASAGA